MTDKARELLEQVIAEADSSHFYSSEIDKEIRAYLAEPEQDEPVAWISHNGFRFNADIEPIEHGIEVPLYLHPAPRPEFVRLSEEEVNSLTYAPLEPYELICAVENRLVEKNRG